jgi:hypothetical protein
VLAVGKKDGYYANLKASRQEEEEQEWRDGLERRERDVKGLENLLKLPPFDPQLLKFGGTKGVTKVVARKRNELVTRPNHHISKPRISHTPRHAS